MSNVIQIKHGPTAPADGVLQPYELGYSDDGNLYIGIENGENSNIVKKIYDTNKNSVLDFLSLNQPKNAIRVSSNDIAYELYEFPKKEFGSDTEMPLQFMAAFYKNASEDPEEIDGQQRYLYRIAAVSPSKIIKDFKLASVAGYGTIDPNIAGPDGTALAGTTGQLYFVITE